MTCKQRGLSVQGLPIDSSEAVGRCIGHRGASHTVRHHIVAVSSGWSGLRDASVRPSHSSPDKYFAFLIFLFRLPSICLQRSPLHLPMADKQTARLCYQVIRSHFGPVAAVRSPLMPSILTLTPSCRRSHQPSSSAGVSHYLTSSD